MAFSVSKLATSELRLGLGSRLLHLCLRALAHETCSLVVSRRHVGLELSQRRLGGLGFCARLCEYLVVLPVRLGKCPRKLRLGLSFGLTNGRLHSVPNLFLEPGHLRCMGQRGLVTSDVDLCRSMSLKLGDSRSSVPVRRDRLLPLWFVCNCRRPGRTLRGGGVWWCLGPRRTCCLWRHLLNGTDCRPEHLLQTVQRWERFDPATLRCLGGRCSLGVGRVRTLGARREATNDRYHPGILHLAPYYMSEANSASGVPGIVTTDNVSSLQRCV